MLNGEYLRSQTRSWLTAFIQPKELDLCQTKPLHAIAYFGACRPNYNSMSFISGKKQTPEMTYIRIGSMAAIIHSNRYLKQAITKLLKVSDLRLSEPPKQIANKSCGGAIEIQLSTLTMR